MKQLFIFCLFVFVGVTKVNAQTWQTPIQAGGSYLPHNINNVFFTSDTQGWAVGDAGIIITTNNGGANWTNQTSGTFQYLYSVYFISSTLGWAVGSSGTILTTSNGGSSWTPQTSGTTQDLRSVFFTSATKGWAVGNETILTTNNGGITWTTQLSSTNQGFTCVFFTSATKGWVVGSTGTILTTSNGGSNWTAQASGTTQTINSIYFTSATQGWAVTDAGVITTSNGGSTWTAQTSGTAGYLFSVCFTSATKGWAVGLNGTILTTNNGGSTWTAQSGSIQWLNSVYFTSATHGCAVGRDGTILTTNNGGNTWTAHTFGTHRDLFSICFTSATQGYAVGQYGTLLTTNNGGLDWTVQTLSQFVFNYLYCIYFASPTHGWIVGDNGVILTTNNGGNTWTAQTSGTTNFLYSVYFTSATKGWVVGDGSILTTNNGGSTWTAQTSGTTQWLSSVYFTSDSQGWAVGGYGTIISTSNGGTSWNIQNSGSIYSLSSVYFINATKGWAVGEYGTILTTNNGGVTWTTQTSGTTNQLNSVYFTSATQGWAIGENGTFLSTNNGGSTWTTQTSGTSGMLYSVYFNNATQGWAVGEAGTILLYGSACTPTTDTLTVSACNSYTWAAKNNTVYTSSNTTDTVHLTNAGGCDSIVTLNLTINHSTTSTTNTTICASALPYTWNGLTFNAAGSQTYHTNNAAGCDSAATLNLTVNPLPLVNAGTDKLICPGTSTSLTASGAVSYSWSGGITNGTTFSPSATTTYVVTGTDANNCSNNDTVVVNVRDLTVSSVTSAICKGVSDTLTAPSGSSYQWKKNGAAIAGKTTRYLYVTVAASYTVTYTDSLCGVKTSPAVVLTLATPPAKPVLAATKAIICPGDTTTLYAVTASYKFIWLLGSTTTILPGVTSQSYHTATIGSYYIKAVDSFGCRSAVSGAKVIKAGAIPVPVVTIVNGTLGSKKLTCTNSGTYQWRLNGNNIAGATSNKYIATQTGAYSVRLTNSTGCVAISPDTTLTITYTGPKMSQEALAVMNNQEDIIVYPNPSEGIFYIEVSEATKAIVTDLQGRKVLETNDTHQINLKENPSGIYFLQLMNEEGMLLKTEKLMKQ